MQPRQNVSTCLADMLPKRVAAELCDLVGVFGRLADRSDLYLRELGQLVNDLQLTPNGTEGYRTAEVTLGGVDANELSSEIMEAKAVPGLYFIGEVVDITGHLGRYIFNGLGHQVLLLGITLDMCLKVILVKPLCAL